jgi:hypothetical protein
MLIAFSAEDGVMTVTATEPPSWPCFQPRNTLRQASLIGWLMNMR